jgi:hypothetical protein
MTQQLGIGAMIGHHDFVGGAHPCGGGVDPLSAWGAEDGISAKKSFSSSSFNPLSAALHHHLNKGTRPSQS